MEAFAALKTQADTVWAARTQPSRPRVDVVIGSCSLAAGAHATLDVLREVIARRKLAIDTGIVGDAGACWAEPNVIVTLPGNAPVMYGPIRANDAAALLDDVVVAGKLEHPAALWVEGDKGIGRIPAQNSLPYWQIQNRRLIGRAGVIDPENIDHYIATGGYAGFAKALGMGQEDIIKVMLDSGLTGRGGANFPTGRKWDFLRTAANKPKYMVCNADEGDPGAFVNRILMESDPHLTIEGILIGAIATGASKGFIYIRDEYPVAVRRMRLAIEQAYAKGLLGENILGTGFSCDMEVVRGAGAYVCGEETGLIASIQDYRGMPRIKPPFPAQAGVFMQPTNVNNVESYASAPDIITKGAQWYSSVGTERAKGTKIWSLSGDCTRVCVIETNLGVTLRDLFETCGGGLRDPRHTLKAVQPGGPLGGFIPASMIDIQLEPAQFSAQGVIMGSGGFVFMDDRSCVVEFTRRLIHFNGDESCGRCTTCRAGNMRLADVMDRLCEGKGIPQDLDIVKQYGGFMANANCAHGQLSPSPLNASLKFFMDEYLEHINERRCKAGACHEMQEYVVIPDRQEQAAAIADVCPTGAIVTEVGRTFIRQDRCIKCGLCAEAAPGAIAKGSPRAQLPVAELAR